MKDGFSLAAMKNRPFFFFAGLFLLMAAVCPREPAAVPACFAAVPAFFTGGPAFFTGGPARVYAFYTSPAARAQPPVEKEGRQDPDAPPESPPAARAQPLAGKPEKSLAASEQALLNELLKLDLQLAEYGQESSRLAARLEENRQLAAKTETALAQTRRRLTEERRRLGGLLDFSYRCGPLSYLDVLLGARTFAEFVNQSFYLSAIISRQAKIIRETRRLAETERAELTRLQELQETMEKDQELLARTVAQTEKLRAGRQQFLADVRRQSAELAARLALVEAQWQKVILGLRATMRKVSALPPGQLMPDRLSFAGGKFHAEIGAAALNRLLAAAGENALKNLKVTITPAGVVISGAVRQPEASFSLQGNFVPAPGGQRVDFSPEALEINNTPVEKDLLAALTGAQGISWDLGESFPALRVLEIKPQENQITITFAGKF